MSVFRRGIVSLCCSWRKRQYATTRTVTAVPEKTPLYDFHVKNRGKLVDFAGYLLPVQYADLGIAASHLFTRSNASIFDVSHMQQTYIRGADSVEFFESLCPADVRGLRPNCGTLTVFTTPSGTIFDDLIVMKVAPDCLYVVSNAAMKAQDMAIMQAGATAFKDVSIEFIATGDRALLAVQGPKAMRLVQTLTESNLSELLFMSTAEATVAGVPRCRISRCGYTGEDGFEISVAAENAAEIAETILRTGRGEVKLAGLGARDSLRLEAGLCLYGTDIDQTTTPVEAALSWLISKRRRLEADFPGARILNEQLKSGVERRRIGFRMKSGGPPARNGVEIYTTGLSPQRIGIVTSGCPGPSVGVNVGMGYVRDEFKRAGVAIQLKIRDRFYPGEIVKMPFVQAGYYTGK